MPESEEISGAEVSSLAEMTALNALQVLLDVNPVAACVPEEGEGTWSCWLCATRAHDDLGAQDAASSTNLPGARTSTTPGPALGLGTGPGPGPGAGADSLTAPTRGPSTGATSAASATSASGGIRTRSAAGADAQAAVRGVQSADGAQTATTHPAHRHAPSPSLEMLLAHSSPLTQLSRSQPSILLVLAHILP